MRTNNRLVSIVLCLFTMACAPVGSGTPADFDREFRDLTSSPSIGCSRCFYVSLSEIIVPIPSRFVASIKIDDRGCHRYIALTGHAIFAMALAKSQSDYLRKQTGTVIICSAETVNALIAESQLLPSPDMTTVGSAATLLRFGKQTAGKDLSNFAAAVLIGEFGVFVSDANPRLADAMAEFVEMQNATNRK